MSKTLNTRAKRLHLCYLCKRAFKTQLQLRLHERFHAVKTPFKCKYCSRNFRVYSILSSGHVKWWEIKRRRSKTKVFLPLLLESLDKCGRCVDSRPSSSALDNKKVMLPVKTQRPKKAKRTTLISLNNINNNRSPKTEQQKFNDTTENLHSSINGNTRDSNNDTVTSTECVNSIQGKLTFTRDGSEKDSSSGGKMKDSLSSKIISRPQCFVFRAGEEGPDKTALNVYRIRGPGSILVTKNPWVTLDYARSRVYALNDSSATDRFVPVPFKRKPWKCRHCLETYETYPDLLKHIETLSDKNKKGEIDSDEFRDYELGKLADRIPKLHKPIGGLVISKVFKRFQKYYAYKPKRTKITDVNDNTISLPFSYTQFVDLLQGIISKQGDSDSELSSEADDDDSELISEADDDDSSLSSSSKSDFSRPTSPAPSICKMVVKWTTERPISSVGLPPPGSHNSCSLSPSDDKDRSALVPYRRGRCVRRTRFRRLRRRAATKRYDDTAFNPTVNLITSHPKPQNIITASTEFYNRCDNVPKLKDSRVVEADFAMAPISNLASNISISQIPLVPREILPPNALLVPALNSTNPDGSSGPMVYQVFQPMFGIVSNVMNISHRGQPGRPLYYMDSNPQITSSQPVSSVKDDNVCLDDSQSSISSTGTKYIYTGVFYKSDEEVSHKNQKEEALKEQVTEENVTKGCVISDKISCHDNMHNDEALLRNISTANSVGVKRYNLSKDGKNTVIPIQRNLENDVLYRHPFTDDTTHGQNVNLSGSSDTNHFNHQIVSKLNTNKKPNNSNSYCTPPNTLNKILNISNSPIKQSSTSRKCVPSSPRFESIEVSTVNSNVPDCSFTSMVTHVNFTGRTESGFNQLSNSVSMNSTCEIVKSFITQSPKYVVDVTEKQHDTEYNVRIKDNFRNESMSTDTNVPQNNTHSDEILLKNILSSDKLRSKSVPEPGKETVLNECGSNLKPISKSGSFPHERLLKECPKIRETVQRLLCMITEKNITISNENTSNRTIMSNKRFIVDESNLRQDLNASSSPKKRDSDQTVPKLSLNKESNDLNNSNNVDLSTKSEITVNNNLLQFEPSNPTSSDSSASFQPLLSWSKEDHDYFKGSVYDHPDEEIDQAVEKSINKCKNPSTEIGIVAKPETEEKGCQVELDDFNHANPCRRTAGSCAENGSAATKPYPYVNLNRETCLNSSIEVINPSSNESSSSCSGNSAAKDVIKRRLFDTDDITTNVPVIKQSQSFEAFQDVSVYSPAHLNESEDSSSEVVMESGTANRPYGSKRKSTSDEDDDFIDQQVPKPTLEEDRDHREMNSDKD